jgi:hypothetical protein
MHELVEELSNEIAKMLVSLMKKSSPVPPDLFSNTTSYFYSLFPTSYFLLATSCYLGSAGMMAPALIHWVTVAMSASEILLPLGGMGMGSSAGPSWRMSLMSRD